MAYFVLRYDVNDNYLEGRVPLREAHLSIAREMTDRGVLLLGGALEEPVDATMLVFTGEDDSAAREFVERDPYVANNLVKRWEIRPWKVVAGALLSPSDRL